MPRRTLTRLILKSPQILLRSGERPGRIVVFDAADGDAGPVPKKSPTPEGATFSAVGYRQTLLPAAKGGKANANGFRFRNGSMRALARSFRGQPFLTGHDWSDVRARGGTITDARLLEIAASGELGLLYDINAVADWAKEGLANGTIDRFSLGASAGEGGINCTVHNIPVWSEMKCFCWPGSAAVDGESGEPILNEDGEPMIAEWEYEDPIGEELSAVNVPAVDGTYIVDASSNEHDVERFVEARRATAESLVALCGRRHPQLDRLTEGGWLEGGFTRPRLSRTIAPCSTEANAVDREQMALSLGLPADATWEQIRARAGELHAQSGQIETIRLQAEETSARLARTELEQHVTAEISRLRASRQLSERMVAHARTQAFGTEQAPVTAAQGRARFDLVVQTIESQPAIAPAPTAGSSRAVLQSDAPAARTDTTAIAASDNAEPDAYEQHATNPELPRILRACRITPDDVRNHGPRAIPVVHNLGDLVAATAQRGA